MSVSRRCSPWGQLKLWFQCHTPEHWTSVWLQHRKETVFVIIAEPVPGFSTNHYAVGHVQHVNSAPELLVRHLGARIAIDGEVLRQHVVHVQRKQRWVNLLARQVACAQRLLS